MAFGGVQAQNLEQSNPGSIDRLEEPSSGTVTEDISGIDRETSRRERAGQSSFHFLEHSKRDLRTLKMNSW
jgi:hypothetical protein